MYKQVYLGILEKEKKLPAFLLRPSLGLHLLGRLDVFHRLRESDIT